ncbi:LuxR family transcriptional regulator [Streptomyces sp. NPDC005167]
MTETDAPWEVVGLDAAAEAVYRQLLAHGRGTVGTVAAEFGLEPERALAMLERLHHSGLLSRRPSGEFLTVDPRHAVRALVASRERQLAVLRNVAEPLGAIFDDARRTATTEPATRTISGPEVVGDCYYRLKQSARAEICALDRPPFLLVPNEPLDEAAMRRGVRVRVVYAAASFEVEAELGSLVSRGEEAKVVPSLPIKLMMADRSAAMVSLSLGPGSTECLYTEAPPLLDALSELFERYWTTAASLSGPGYEPAPAPGPSAEGDHDRMPTDEERNLLALFAAGVKDDTIARQFGISTRTLRRRIQDLYAELGTTNRFGAGVAAARRNWV